VAVVHYKYFLSLLKVDKKGVTGGLVTGLVMGIAGLVIGVIIALIITSTLGSANLVGSDSSSSITVTNETEAWLNISGYTLDNYNSSNSGFTITTIWGNTPQHPLLYNYSISTANASVSSVGVVTNASTIPNSTIYDNVSLSYTYSYTYARTTEQYAIDNMTANFSEGIDNISDKLPTVLLIAAIVLIIAILGILVAVWQRMRLTSGSQGL
jgi:hypothetical protein